MSDVPLRTANRGGAHLEKMTQAIGSDEVNITVEDQLQINQFARHNQTLQEVEAAIKAKNEEVQKLQDAADELMLGESLVRNLAHHHDMSSWLGYDSQGFSLGGYLDFEESILPPEKESYLQESELFGPA